jgi:hypothetical protein
MSEMTAFRLDQADRRADMIDARAANIESKIDGIDFRLRAVETKLGEINGQLTLLVGKIPSRWQPPVSAAGLLALLVAALGILKYFKIFVQ